MRGASAIPFPRDWDRRPNFAPDDNRFPEILRTSIAMVGELVVDAAEVGVRGNENRMMFRLKRPTLHDAKSSARPRPTAPVIPNSPTSVSPCSIEVGSDRD